MTMDKGKYFKLFKQETFERISKIEDLLLKMEEIGIKENLLAEIKREMHTIKGSAKIIGFNNTSEIAHTFEELFKDKGKIEKFSLKEIANLTLKSLKTIKTLVEKNDDISQVIEEWNEIKEKIENIIKTKDTKKITFKKENDITTSINIREKIKKKFLNVSTQQKEDKIKNKEIESETYLEELPDVFKIDANTIDEISKSAIKTKVLQNKLESIPEILNFYIESLNKVFSKLSKVVDSRDLIEFRDLINLLEEQKEDIVNSVENQQRAFKELWDKISELKLIQLSVILDIYPSYIRNFSKKFGKKIDLKITGSKCKIDKRIVEKLNEALIHIVRNAISHGIEPPEERRKINKSEKGKLEIKISENRGVIAIQISDDGRGIDTEKIKKKALEKGLYTAEELGKKNERELMDIIYESGFSTAENIDEISGRGIGMDVVKRKIEEIGGNVSIKSKVGEGTTVTIEIPVSISTHKVIIFNLNKSLLGFMEENIERIEKFDVDKIRGEGKNFYLYNHEILPLISLTENREGDVIFFKKGGKKVAIFLKNILSREEVIIKKSSFLSGYLQFNGFGIDHKSRIITILNPFKLDENMRFDVKEEKKVLKKKKILLVEDSAITRELEKNILEKNGFEVVEAENGVEAFEKLGAEDIDLIISDIDMPIMDGFTMVEKIKKKDEYRNIPIIIVTMKESNEDKLRAIHLGVDGYITKENFMGTRLLRIVNKFL